MEAWRSRRVEPDLLTEFSKEKAASLEKLRQPRNGDFKPATEKEATTREEVARKATAEWQRKRRPKKKQRGAQSRLPQQRRWRLRNR